MARFVLLWVPDNDKVEPIIEKLSTTSVTKVVGTFAEPTSFCDASCGRENTEAWRRDNPQIVHPVWGTYHCPLCKKAMPYMYHHLHNGLDPKNLPAHMRSLSLILKMPDVGGGYGGRTAIEIYGEEAVEAGIRDQLETKNIVKRVQRQRRRRR